MCFVDDGAELVDGKSRLRNEIALFVDPGAVGHVHLNPVCAVAQLLASCLARLYGTIDQLRAGGHVEFGSVILQVVSTSRGDRARGDEQARPWNGAFLDGLLDFYIAVARAFSLQVAQSGESLLQGTPRRVGGAGRAERDSGF